MGYSIGCSNGEDFFSLEKNGSARSPYQPRQCAADAKQYLDAPPPHPRGLSLTRFIRTHHWGPGPAALLNTSLTMSKKYTTQPDPSPSTRGLLDKRKPAASTGEPLPRQPLTSPDLHTDNLLRVLHRLPVLSAHHFVYRPTFALHRELNGALLTEARAPRGHK